jgi:hypothetical protein
MRKQKLIVPEVQLPIATWTLAAAAAGLTVELLVVLRVVASTVPELTGDVAADQELLRQAVIRSQFLVFGLAFPVISLVAVLSSFRFAGPLFRITRFLQRVEDGHETEECKLREHDKLGDLCELVNSATLRRRAENAAELESAEQERRAA